MVNKIHYSMERIPGLTCPSKWLLKINGENICFSNSEKGCKEVIEYAVSLDESKLENNKIKRKIRKVLEKER